MGKRGVPDDENDERHRDFMRRRRLSNEEGPDMQSGGCRWMVRELEGGEMGMGQGWRRTMTTTTTPRFRAASSSIYRRGQRSNLERRGWWLVSYNKCMRRGNAPCST